MAAVAGAVLLASLLLLLGGGGLGAAPAYAQAPVTPPDILPPAGVDPWTAARNGQYTNLQYSDLAKRLGYGLDSQFPAKSALSEAQFKYFQQRGMVAASRGGLIPLFKTAVPYIRLAGGAGAVALTGYAVYQLVTTDWDGGTHTQFVEFELERIGGGSVVKVGNPYVEGRDWRFRTGTGDDVFGWRQMIGLGNTSGEGLVFQYATEMAWGNTSTTCTNNCYPLWGGSSQTPAPFVTSGTPDLDLCVGIMSSCYGTPLTGTAAGLQFAQAQAANLTMGELAGDLIPLRVLLDSNATAIGHIRPSSPCTASGGFQAAPCKLSYVSLLDAERLFPRRIRESNPSGTAVTTTTTTTAPDLDTAAEWASTTTELDDDCGRAIFNHIAAPSRYGYSGCDPSSSDPGAGPTVPVPEPVTLPRPITNESYPQYIARLQALGILGATGSSNDYTTEEVALQEGYGPQSPVRIVVTEFTAPGVSTQRVFDPLVWPQPNPTVPLSRPDPNAFPRVHIRIRHNPTSAPEVVEPGSGTPGGGGPGEETGPDCNCPPLDFSPLNVGAGDKFPFGLFGYVTGFFDQFAAGATAPGFSIGKPAVLGGGTLSVTAPAFTHKGTTDSILKFVVILASVWFAGTWITGWYRRGDSLAE